MKDEGDKEGIKEVRKGGRKEQKGERRRGERDKGVRGR